MATHSSILTWRIPWTEDLAGYSPWGLQRVRHDLATNTTTSVVIYFLARGILVPQPGIEPMPPALEAQGPNHWNHQGSPQNSPP